MAGDWLKWEKGLARKPEVLRIARALKSSPQHAAGACMQVWEWADDNTIDGIVEGISADDLDTITGMPGIGQAMADVGWLLVLGRDIQFPNFRHHNGDPAKQRAQDAMRKRIRRATGQMSANCPVANRTKNGNVQG